MLGAKKVSVPERGRLQMFAVVLLSELFLNPLRKRFFQHIIFFLNTHSKAFISLSCNMYFEVANDFGYPKPKVRLSIKFMQNFTQLIVSA